MGKWRVLLGSQTAGKCLQHSGVRIACFNEQWTVCKLIVFLHPILLHVSNESVFLCLILSKKDSSHNSRWHSPLVPAGFGLQHAGRGPWCLSILAIPAVALLGVSPFASSFWFCLFSGAKLWENDKYWGTALRWEAFSGVCARNHGPSQSHAFVSPV